MLYEFTASGPATHQKWRRTIPPNQVVRLGRAPRRGWAVPWDPRISREHADLILANGRLRVRRLASARNRIYVHGEPLEEFSVSPGEDFRIGRTTFCVCRGADAENEPSAESNPAASSGETDLKRLARQPARRRLMGILHELEMEDATGTPASQPGGIPGLSGTRLEQYELLETLHHGSSSIVVKAWHRYLEDFAAVQFLLADPEADSAAGERFRRKARWLRHWDHPNLIRVLDAGIVRNRAFLVMEFHSANPLRDGDRAAVGESGIQAVLGYVRQAASALDYVHRRGVVHGCIRPTDLLVNEQGRVKLTGWSRAREMQRSGEPADETAGPGLPAAADGESGKTAEAGVSGDIYHLGIALATLLAGTSQNGGPDNSSAASGGSIREPQPAARAPTAAALAGSLPRDLPSRWQDVVFRMTAADRAERFRCMAEVIRALRAPG